MKNFILATALLFSPLLASAQLGQFGGGGNSGSGASTNPTTDAIPVKSGINTFADIVNPTSPNGVAQSLTSTPSGGVGVRPVFSLPGVATNAQTGTTYTVAATDRASYVSFSNAGAIAVTLPQAGTTGFANSFVMVACDIGAGTATITPTTSTISYTDGSAYTSGAASLALTTGQCVSIKSDNSNYFAQVFKSGSGVSVTSAGVGGTWFPTITTPTATTNQSLTANQNVVRQFVLPYTTKVSNLTVNVTTGVAASVCDVGIYDSSGNQLTHVSAGFSCVNIAQVKSAASPVVTLSPGVYFAAVCMSSGTVALSGLSLGVPDQIMQAAETGVSGTAANPCTAGVLPATLGTVTNTAGPNIMPLFFGTP